MKKYKNIIFDVGDVLLDYRWRTMLQDYGLSQSEAERIGGEMFNDPEQLWSQMDLGIEDQEAVIRKYEKKYPEDAKVIRWFIEHGEYMHKPRRKVWEMIPMLKSRGYGIYLLSNYPEVLFHKHTQYADFMQEIDGLMVSYMIHEMNPHADIYHALLNKYGLKAEECIFFDDRLENVQAALRIGMGSKQVHSQESLLSDLAKLM